MRIPQMTSATNLDQFVKIAEVQSNAYLQS